MFHVKHMAFLVNDGRSANRPGFRGNSPISTGLVDGAPTRRKDVENPGLGVPIEGDASPHHPKVPDLSEFLSKCLLKTFSLRSILRENASEDDFGATPG